MKTFALLINASSAENKEIPKTLRTSFPSEDYMRGFVEAYTFGRAKLMTLEKYQKAQHIKVSCNTADDCYLYFLTVEEPEDFEDD